MGRKQLYAISIVMLVVFIIVTILVWDAMHLERRSKVYEISVIIRGRQNSYWDAVKQGVDQAVSDMTVDLSYITLENENDAEEQAAIIHREVENGANAIVVAPCANVPVLQSAIENARRRTVVVDIEYEVGGASACVLTDNAAMGAELAVELVRSGKIDNNSYTVLLPPNASASIMERCSAFGAVMLEAGTEYKQWVLADQPEGYLSEGNYVALDHVTLQNAAHALSKSYGFESSLCGIGSSGEIAYFLENGVIDFTIADSAYSLGYMGIKSAIDILKNQKHEKKIVLDFSLITSNDMYETDKQRMLFPFVK